MSIPKRVNKVLLNAYKRRKQAHCDLSLEHCLRVVRATVSRTKYCFFITPEASGSPSARLVEPIADLEALTFFIGTHAGSRKINRILACPSVTLAFSSAGEDANLVVYGTATVSDEPALKERYWKATWRLFFPDGPESKDYVVVKVCAEKIELLNFQRNVIPEPFGLRPAVLEKTSQGWRVQYSPGVASEPAP